MTKVDIFAQAKEKVMPTWAKFQKDGDCAQGTYIGKIVGQIDGYGNEQVIYQLLQDDGSVMNVGFGLNKKFIIQDMAAVKWGQIIGFKYKGMISVPDKRRPGETVNVKDFGLHQDIKIIDQKWLDENKDCMPEVSFVTDEAKEISEANAKVDKEFDELGKDGDEVPFESEPVAEELVAEPTITEDNAKEAEELTEDDKLAIIEKLAKDKLEDAVDSETVKTAVMEKFSIAFIPINYSDIIEKLKTL